MTKTEFLGLVLSGMSDEDLDQTFLEYRQAINGENCGSNMELIDAAVKSLNTAVAALVKTVNGKSPDSAGAVTLSASDVGARPSTWMPSAADVGGLRVLGSGDFATTNLVEIYRSMPNNSIFLADASNYIGNTSNNLPSRYGMITILSLSYGRKKMTMNRVSGSPVAQLAEEYIAEFTSDSTTCTWYQFYTTKQMPSAGN